MKRFTLKIPAAVGLGMHLLSFAFLALAAALCCKGQPFTVYGENNAFSFWIPSVISALISIPFYLIDKWLILSDRHNDVFLVVLTLLVLGSIPMVFLFGGSPRGTHILIWNLYYLSIFILETVSMVRYIKKQCSRL